MDNEREIKRTSMDFLEALYRKIISGCITVTILTVIIFTIVELVLKPLDFGAAETIFYVSAFISQIVFFYVIPISLCIEYVYTEYLLPSNALFIGLHCIVGILALFAVPELFMGGPIIGVIIGTLFAYIDRLISLYKMKGKWRIVVFALPIVLFVLIRLFGASMR